MRSFLTFIVLFSSSIPLSAQWIQTGGPYGGAITCIAKSGTMLLAATDMAGVFVSSNNGASWAPSDSGLSDLHVKCLAVNGDEVAAGTSYQDSGRVFLSTDNGRSWKETKFHSSYKYSSPVMSLGMSGTNLWVGTVSRGLFLSKDKGNINWNNVYYGPSNSLVGDDIASTIINKGVILASVYGYGIVRSTDNGSSWNRAALYGSTSWTWTLSLVDSVLFAGTQGDGVAYSADNGITWTQTSTALVNYGYSVVSSGPFLYVGSINGAVFRSNDTGRTWISVSTGLPQRDVYGLVISGDFLVAALEGGSFWRRPLQELSTVDKARNPRVPSACDLNQNYPNPFNPTTIISYELPAVNSVSLKVFDVLGQEVATLAAGEQPAGVFAMQWDASKYPSGIYFYRLVAGQFTMTKKMLLAK